MKEEPEAHRVSWADISQHTLDGEITLPVESQRARSHLRI